MDEPRLAEIGRDSRGAQAVVGSVEYFHRGGQAALGLRFAMRRLRLSDAFVCEWRSELAAASTALIRACFRACSHPQP